MSNYISREDVKKLLWERISLATFMRRGIPNAMKSLSLISEELEKIPDADVWPVVYCRDCKHAPEPDGPDYGVDVRFPDDACPFKCCDTWYNVRPSPEFFCKNGERREEDTP